MLLRVVLAIALCACSSKKTEPQSRFAIVPDQVLAQLVEFGTGLSVDLHGLDLARMGSLFPDGLGCAQELLEHAHVAVATLAGDTWEGHITGLDEAKTRTCLGTVAPMLGLDLHQLDLAWQGDDAMIAQTGHP